MFATGEKDTFEFDLARELRQPLDVVRSWPNLDVMEWAAYFRLQSERQAHAQMRQRARAKR